MAKQRNTSADFNFRFENRSQRKRFKKYAAENENPINSMIIDALWKVYPKLMKDDKNGKENIGK